MGVGVGDVLNFVKVFSPTFLLLPPYPNSALAVFLFDFLCFVLLSIKLIGSRLTKRQLRKDH